METKSESKKCIDRIYQELERRIEEFKKILKSDEPIEEINNISLSWDGARLELSYGGPQDFFIFTKNRDGELVSITYHFLDWFDGACVSLNKEAYNIMEEIYDNYLNFYITV